ncbi:class I SAM-dependent methyltransferase [Flavobacterium psychrophilum]|uniref:class I SAM-dependent methyltransferase n=1 Tax=Flavobacterium psychrophilum TaxID=96345 RepID=UPI000B7C0BAF|nr:class I SAM-dependent methyltransferase [Flavobacterium psychrophilum]EKT4499182.1 class I SAM-dependent methyltransferase [Flavobacterium psychrophilum]QZK98295.1 class I SAM-dependent methyltransferase [Flavobacterium psychrophilum]SNA76791.1 Methyltransferase type 11 [Flavobacterium psychrophilum]
MKCKICESESKKIFEKIVLLKYNVNYYQCSYCDFVQTDEPFWLEEAYQSAITSLDIGILIRNNYLVYEVSKIIDSCFLEAKKMLDYAGGYGLFVRLMRDKGYDFFRQDIYCDNLFADHFDITNIKETKFDIVTGFEVLEHFSNPLKEIEEIFNYSENAIFSTEIIPDNHSDIQNWVYISQETGQHIAFYSSKAMQIIAKKFGKNYYCKNKNIHIFTTKTLTEEQLDYYDNEYIIIEKYFGLKKKQRTKQRIIRESFQQRDYELIKKLLILNSH